MKYTFEDAQVALDSHWVRRDGEIDIRSCWPMLEVGPGWADVIVHAVRMAEDYFPDFELYQVKEKFGGLRFYANLPSVLEYMIENMAASVCEECGAVGAISRKKSGWMKTLCEEHRTIDGVKEYFTEWEMSKE